MFCVCVKALFNAIFYSTVVYLTVVYSLYLDVYVFPHPCCIIVREVGLSLVVRSGLALMCSLFTLWVCEAVATDIDSFNVTRTHMSK